MNVGWLVIALGVVVVAIGGYSAYLISRRRKLERRISEFHQDSEGVPPNN